METLGTDFNSTGSVLSRSQLEELRRRRGECLTCGRKCFQKRLFKLIPLTEEGSVLEGRCLKCRPLPPGQHGSASPLPSLQGSHRTTSEDRERFTRTQSNLSNRSGSSPNPSGRSHISRTVSDLSRSENSTGPSLSPRQQFRRVASAMPSTASKAPARMTSLPITLATTDEASEHFTPPPQIETQPPPPPPPESAHQPQSSVPVVDNSVAAAREPSDKQLSVPIENAGARKISKTMFKSLSTKFAGTSRKNSEGGNFRSTQRKSLSAQLPTKEELEQAHLTILAAQQHGIYGSRSNSANFVGLPDELGAAVSNIDQNIQQVGPSSSRELASPITIPQVIPNEIDGYPVPQHGVLNRGGMVAIVPTTSATSSGQPYSNHSFVSASSIEDFKRASSSRQVDTVTQSPVTNHIPDLPESVVSDHSQSPMTKLTEEEALDSLDRAGQNIDLILQIMRENSTTARIATTALERLAAWKLSPDDQNRLGNSQAHMVIVDIMHLYLNTHSVYVAALGALWNMSGTTQNQVAIASSRALDWVLTAMDQFVDSAEIQENSMAILSNLGAVSENLDILSQKGALNKVVDTMTKFSEVSSIQVKGCGAVSNLAAHDDGPVRQRLMECGAGGTIVVAMVMHPNDTYLVEKALRALRNICANSDDNKIEVANIGGVDSVITAMQVHRDVLAVQKEGAWTLSNLATNHTNRDVIGECGGIDVVIRAIWVHSGDVELLEWCCRALFTLTLAEPNCEIVLEVGGISAIVNTMQGHVDSAIVQEMGCAVLGNLAGNDHSRARIVEEEALDAIVLAMVLHTNEIQVQERACTVLSRLAVPANHYAMIAANIPELVRQAASNFPDRCHEPATRVLNILSEAY